MADARRAVAVLAERGWVLSLAESCTAGLVAAAITDIAGSSAVFDRGFVTYSNAAKVEMLGVPAPLIAEQGAVSEDVARAMASGALSRSEAQIAVSVTGIAGPGGSDFKPEGRVCFSVAVEVGDRQEQWSETVEFGALGRANVRQAAVQHVCDLIVRAAG